jgi:hypothetical protein
MHHFVASIGDTADTMTESLETSKCIPIGSESRMVVHHRCADINVHVGAHHRWKLFGKNRYLKRKPQMNWPAQSGAFALTALDPASPIFLPHVPRQHSIDRLAT